jgi:hypothetical protein
VPGSLSEKVERSGLCVREYETESGDYLSRLHGRKHGKMFLVLKIEVYGPSS